ncbi:MAG: hypothetical protein ACXVB1_18255 [Pseudobdellovibrionaceae bacterium]
MRKHRNEKLEARSEGRFSREENRKRSDWRENDRYSEDDERDCSNRGDDFEDEGVRGYKSYKHSENRRR